MGCAVCPWGDEESIYVVISVFRFLVGVGVGGIDPLSATHGMGSPHRARGRGTVAA